MFTSATRANSLQSERTDNPPGKFSAYGACPLYFELQLIAEIDRDIPAEIADFLAPACVNYPRQVEAHVEVSLDIPAKTRADAGDRDLLPGFPGQLTVGRTGDVIEQQAAQVTFARDQCAR